MLPHRPQSCHRYTVQGIDQSAAHYRITHDETESAACRLTVTGDLDEWNCDHFTRQVIARAERVEVVELDLSALNYIGAAGIRSLIQIRQILKADKQKLRICALSPIAQRLFDILDITTQSLTTGAPADL